MPARLSREEQIERMTENHQGFYSYENWGHPLAQEKSMITCPVHGDFSQGYSHHVGGRGCPNCGKLKISQATKSQWQNPEYRKLVSRSSKRFMKKLWQDPEFRERRVQANRNQRNGPSKGEQSIRDTLEGLGFIRKTKETNPGDYWDFEEEKFIPGTGYHFDFWLPRYDLIIEFHGVQHYTGWAGKPENLKKKQANDQFKANWAKEWGHDLLIIPYWDLANIPIILSKVFNQ